MGGAIGLRGVLRDGSVQRVALHRPRSMILGPVLYTNAREARALETALQAVVRGNHATLTAGELLDLHRVLGALTQYRRDFSDQAIGLVGAISHRSLPHH